LPSAEESKELAEKVRNIIAAAFVLITSIGAYLTAFFQAIPPISLPSFDRPRNAIDLIRKDENIAKELRSLRFETDASRVFIGIYKEINGRLTVYVSPSLESKEPSIPPLIKTYRELASPTEIDAYHRHESGEFFIVKDEKLLTKNDPFQLVMKRREDRALISHGFMIYPINNEEGSTLAFVQLSFRYSLTELSPERTERRQSLLKSRVERINLLVNEKILSMGGEP
jgi:hypothetical protein